MAAGISSPRYCSPDEPFIFKLVIVARREGERVGSFFFLGDDM